MGYFLSCIAFCFNTQPPEGGWVFNHALANPQGVSTHSRLKAAAGLSEDGRGKGQSFNTQPPEGG